MNYLEVRREILDVLKRELVGPTPGLPAVQTGVGGVEAAGQEILRPQDPPRMRYGAGILFPLRAPEVALASTSESEAEVTTSSDERRDGDSTDSDAADEGEPHLGSRHVSNADRDRQPDTDSEVNKANEYLPSAMGVTALVRAPDALRVRVSAGRYVPGALPGHGWTDRNGNQVPAWWRVPIDAEVVIPRDRLLLATGPFQEPVVLADGTSTRLYVHVFSRSIGSLANHPDERLVTFTLINRNEAESGRARDDDCFFQCRFEVAATNGSPCFREYPERRLDGGVAPDHDVTRLEEDALQLLYRHRKVYAVGHGCAAEWPESEAEAVHRVWSEVLPSYEVRPIVPAALEGVNLSMLLLSSSDHSAWIGICRTLVARYREWIEAREREVDATDPSDGIPASRLVPDHLKSAARAHLANCRACLQRIEHGVSLLASNSRARRAFSLMNRAMLMQQIHYGISTEHGRNWVSHNRKWRLERPFELPSYEDPERRWWPFQLAFILMNIRSIVEPDCDERQIADVIWFPTGGGKTEAYLGLSAFTIFFRRLRNPADAGTTVLMRYTLRLLTAQQYQRAASLVCACEHLRRQHPEELGSERITIGLWVGSGVTPNREGDAVAKLQRMLAGDRDNPFVILSCPWCGAQMGPVKAGSVTECKGYRQLAAPGRVRHVCEDPGCEFSTADGLPLLVVDEHMYAEPPTIVIGTVDKFALLPWYPEARTLFGIGGESPRTPPDLIVQDELHLISGPLGSMVGHYETVIDALTRRQDGTPAKIVASTATISRAAEQIHALYARRSSFLFPPQGLRSGESFFATEDVAAPGRLYVGVFAAGLPSHQTSLVRTLSALLQAPATMADVDPLLRDPYWTLMCYFSSLRELGHMATMISADIREYMGVIWERLGLTPQWSAEAASTRRFLRRADVELTSRVPGGEVTDAMKALFERFDGKLGSAIDVCLATNMIQVGLDVSRLSLMVVAGQPKATSEYIQASSRVGRKRPGLVVTVYNPSGPRDRSHFEHFRSYHQSIYRHVEPTSVTPFAISVRERALHALVVTLARYWGSAQLREYPSPAPAGAVLDRIRSTVLERVREVDPSEADATSELLDRILANWQRLPAERYGSFAPPSPDVVPMMYPAGGIALPDWDDRAVPTPSSMRNVDANCDARPVMSYPTVGV